ncbi:uncharacterized protein LOC119898629 isoform X3 [Micropterus salmoides]|uniref:uncharacterized protein LOC119898629 isoform X3 n=1 Tax=Micropterus salmoides TaxID=27706 RepID=UPI0018ED86CA|nr:uncharacterized protein LOC119898629 isoform X3 [Micropterus salmoides]
MAQPPPFSRSLKSCPDKTKDDKPGSSPQSPTKSPEPVPMPRKNISRPDKTKDEKPVCNTTPLSPTRSPEVGAVTSTGGLGCSSPPPVLPKKWTVKKDPGGFDSVNGINIVKVLPELSINDNRRLLPLLRQKPLKEQPDDKNEIMDANSLMDWWKNVTAWNTLCEDIKLGGEKETKVIRIKAEHLYKAVLRYVLLLSEHGGTLKQHTAELVCIADNLDKVSKGTKIAGITGGATSVAGGVAAAAGVILCPLTMGASLGLTVLGVGVAAAGGVTGASAAIANKVNVSQEKKKIEKIFQEYSDLMEDIQDCLKFINEGMEQLKKHDLSVLIKARMDSARVAGMIQLSTTGGASARAIEANSKASGMMQGFALGMDMYFTQGKNGQKLKKGLESKFAKKIRQVAQDLNEALDELMQIKDLFSKHCSGEK